PGDGGGERLQLRGGRERQLPHAPGRVPADGLRAGLRAGRRDGAARPRPGAAAWPEQAGGGGGRGGPARGGGGPRRGPTKLEESVAGRARREEWLPVAATVSTSADQTVIGPGDLVREWRHG